MNSILKADIDQAVQRQERSAAIGMMRRLLMDEPGLMTAQYVLDRIKKIAPSSSMKAVRVMILRSFTLEPVVPLLRAKAAVYGIDLSVCVGGFNTYAQDILDPDSILYRETPDIVILATQTCDVAPELWADFTGLSEAGIRQTIAGTMERFRSLVGGVRSRSQAHLVIHTLEQPLVPSAGILDAQSPQGQIEAIATINRGFVELAREHRGVYLLDYNALVARVGRTRWRDEQKWLTVRLPIAAEHLTCLADEYMRFILPLTGRVCKALVVDLDNTLWGGVIGEDGSSGIRLGPEYPGAAYQALQRAILDLYRRGIILAVCSKNNMADAMEVLENHPSMLLRPKYFAALRINWNDKACSLREVAAELNIGIDSLAFLDDNPIEREQIRRLLPEVSVIDLPEDPMGYAAALRACPLFERVKISEEDIERGRLYNEERQRAELKRGTESLEDFYHSLEMRVETSMVTPESVARVSQLTQKTNQFNLTTKRYSEQEIQDLAARPGWKVRTLRVVDRFGDSGLVGVSITRQEGDACEIEVFLMSCRVIGRTVETAFLASLAKDASSRGIRFLRGWFLPTRKNEPARDFYQKHGFRAVQSRDEGVHYELDLHEQAVSCPGWIVLEDM
jgi:FkbH-like protein